MANSAKTGTNGRALIGIIGGLLTLISVFIGWGYGTAFLQETKSTSPNVTQLPIEFSYLYILFFTGLLTFILYLSIFLFPNAIKNTSNLTRLIFSLNLLALMFAILGVVHIMMKYHSSGLEPGCPTAIVGSILGIISTIHRGPIADIFRYEQRAARIEEEDYFRPGLEKLKPIDLHERTVYLVKEDKPGYSFILFTHMLKQGRKGMCISRMHPSKITERFKLDNVPMFWLSKASESGEGTNLINPVNIGIILNEIQNFLKNNENGVVLLDGLEYLIVQHEFPRVLRLLHEINDVVMSSKGILLLPFNMTAIHEEERALLKRDMRVIVPEGHEEFD